MKRTYVLAILAVAAFFAMSGIVMADIPVNATPETKGISVTSNINAQGTVTASDSLTWQQSSDALDAPPLKGAGFLATWFDADGNPVSGWTVDDPFPGMLGDVVPTGEVQYSAGYTE